MTKKNLGKTKAGGDRKRPAREGEGRPTKYNEEIAHKICMQLTEGRSLNKLIKEEKGMPVMSTVFEWIWNNKEFSEKYAKARQVQAESFVDEIMDISDGEHEKGRLDVQRARLMTDTRKWYASKIIPKIYGDTAKTNLQVTVDNKDVNVPARVSEKDWVGDE